MINKQTAITYDDIQLIPSYSEIKSRKNINLNTLVSRRYGILNPIVATPMDTICEYDMALKLAELGGIGCIHRFMTVEDQSDIVYRLNSKIYDDSTDLSIAEQWGVMFDSWHAQERRVPIMAAIGVSDTDLNRAVSLIESGANIILIDVAHGHHINVINMIKSLKLYINSNAPHVDIIAGSITTSSAGIDLQEAGVDGLRVGVGNGSTCSTRIKTGFGIPSVTAVQDVVSVAKVPVIADGGIRNSGDIAKALGVGADCVMLGNLLSGTEETPGNTFNYDGKTYKNYRGSASLETKLRHSQENRNIEGESIDVPYKGSVTPIIIDLLDGVKSALSYVGANNLKEYSPNYVQVTNAGQIEAKPHLIN